MPADDYYSAASAAGGSVRGSISTMSRTSGTSGWRSFSDASSFMATTESSPSFDVSFDDSCMSWGEERSLSPAPFEEDPLDFLELSDEPPGQKQLEDAANIPIYDADGNSRPFRSLYQGSEHQGQRQLVIFVRHFYCKACQEYLKRLTETITPSAYFSLPIPTTITIVACGSPGLIPQHASITHCPFRMYTDPTRRLYKTFGMPMTISPGRRTPDYMKDGAVKMVLKTTLSILRAGIYDGTAGGSIMQVGGEYLFEDGEPIWCHRMRNFRDHAEMKVLKRVLDMDSEQQIASWSLRGFGSLRSIHEHEKLQAERPRRLRLVFHDRGIAGGITSDVPRATLARFA